ncbi:MAG: hypothetical protein OWU84_04685 [Firmicutes bacterium]|nr:hypothetical protein [Bacillota bacterium]
MTNQHFVSIPFRKLINMLQYKLADLGIALIETPEPFTSKASALSDDIVEIQAQYRETRKHNQPPSIHCSGKRIARGLYKDNRLNKVFHADLNGSFNILKVGAQLHLRSENWRQFLYKLCNPRCFTMTDWIYHFQVSPSPRTLAGDRG